ncbi:UNKNOWN [Stylonychia lemnae]|uniref:C2H2-type domain-containing protein n=1 Tax=Stylonychia lemnae TaxID=5949 RepID=A0A078A8W5_STYLE|nr:UNKNOWN [Stylonychia lemnae]|eukprot:CDW77987.1 UNKNOWN [Stylonychia lemnae]
MKNCKQVRPIGAQLQHKNAVTKQHDCVLMAGDNCNANKLINYNFKNEKNLKSDAAEQQPTHSQMNGQIQPSPTGTSSGRRSQKQIQQHQDQLNNPETRAQNGQPTSVPSVQQTQQIIQPQQQIPPNQAPQTQQQMIPQINQQQPPPGVLPPQQQYAGTQQQIPGQIPPQMQNRPPGVASNIPMQQQMIPGQIRPQQQGYPPQQFPPGQQNNPNYMVPPNQFAGQIPPQNVASNQQMYPQQQYQRNNMMPQQIPNQQYPNGQPPQVVPNYGQPANHVQATQMSYLSQQNNQYLGPNSMIIQQQQQQQQMIQKFDQTVQNYVQNMYLEKAELGGIQVEMQKTNYNYLSKNYENFLKIAPPQDKMNFLSETLLKRKSLVNKSSKRYKAISKKKEPNSGPGNRNSNKATLKCPVYACFREMHDDQQLMQHYNEAHSNLKAMGLDLILDAQSSQLGGGLKTNVKGKIHNNLLTQTLIISILHKTQVKELLQELNDELPALD